MSSILKFCFIVFIIWACHTLLLYNQTKALKIRQWIRRNRKETTLSTINLLGNQVKQLLSGCQGFLKKGFWRSPERWTNNTRKNSSNHNKKFPTLLIAALGIFTPQNHKKFSRSSILILNISGCALFLQLGARL